MGGKLDEPGTIRVTIEASRGRLEHQSRLAGATRADQRDEAMTLDMRPQLGKLVGSADERGELLGKVADGLRAQGGEIALETLTDDLKERPRDGEVLQAMPAQVPEAKVGRRPVGEQLDDRRRREDLAAVPGRGEASRTMDVETDVRTIPEAGLSDVKPHPHPNVRSRRPLVRSKFTLRLNGRP